LPGCCLPPGAWGCATQTELLPMLVVEESPGNRKYDQTEISPTIHFNKSANSDYRMQVPRQAWVAKTHIWSQKGTISILKFENNSGKPPDLLATFLDKEHPIN
jgi:hypothetical protein